MTSTLIEFPGAARPQQPAWRKQLSERVREIQERRARDAEQEEAMLQLRSRATAAHAVESSAAAQQLGLVPPPVEERPVNPIVVAALRRIERARQTLPQTPSSHVAAPSPLPSAPSPALPSPAESLAVALKRPANVNRSSATQTIAEAQAKTTLQPSATARAQSTPSGNTPPLNGTAPETENLHIDKKMTKPVTHGVDVNSPAYLKYKQEEEARNRAKLLGAKMLAAKQPAAPTAHAKTIAATAVASRATSAALAAEVTEPESAGHDEPVADSAAPRQAKPAPLTAQAAHQAAHQAATRDATRSAARRVSPEILDEVTLARREAEEAASQAAQLRKSPSDYAPFTARIAGGAIDAIAVIFICSPIAAAFELGYGNWSDIRVVLAMTLCVATITFLYIAAATVFAGRTWGMSLVNLRTVDVESGMSPSVTQGVRRGAAYVFSLLLFGLGFLYALIDPEGRGAHDHLSGTVVISE